MRCALTDPHTPHLLLDIDARCEGVPARPHDEHVHHSLEQTRAQDTSTRQELVQHLTSIKVHADNLLARLERGDDPGDMQTHARELHRGGQRVAILAAYARALRPTLEQRQAPEPTR